MSNLILRAARFARKAHKGQVRKYTNVEYISHPARVAGRMAVHIQATEERVAAAFLHDTIEDTDTNFKQLETFFGRHVADLVKELTDPTCPALGDTYKSVSRADRKAVMRRSLEYAMLGTRIIKLLDRIDNLRDTPIHFSNQYIRMYLEESRLLAEVIGSADPDLKAELLEICDGD